MTARPTGTASPGALGTLLLCGFVVPVSNSMIFPALSDLQDRHGFPATGLGLISAAGFLFSLVVQLFLAPRADRGHPKRFVLAALLLATLGSVLFAFGDSLWTFVLGRGVAGASLGTSGPAVRALVANLDREGSAERLGRLRGIELAGFTGGPLIGALLIGPLGLRGAFLAFSGVALASFVLVAARELPSLPSSGESRRPSLELLALPRVRAAALASLTLFIPVGIYDSLWDRYITDRGGDNFMVGLTFLLYTVPFIVLGAAGGRLADRRGAERMTVMGIFLTAPMVFVYGLLESAWVLVGFAVVEGVIGALSVPATQSLIAKVAPHGRASATQGLAGSGDLVAATLLSLLSPTIYGSLGPAATFGVAAGLMCLTGTAVAVMLSRAEASDRG